MKAPKPAKGTVRIRTMVGNVREVQAEIYGPLAVTPCLPLDGVGWRVTHVASTLALPGTFISRPAARRALLAVLPLLNWRFKTAGGFVRRNRRVSKAKVMQAATQAAARRSR